MIDLGDSGKPEQVRNLFRVGIMDVGRVDCDAGNVVR